MITVDAVHRLQEVAITGGEIPGLLDEDCVERSLGAALNAVRYAEDAADLPDVLRFAAGVAWYLAKNHCYNNANKRTAWLAATDILLRHDLTLPEDETGDAVRLMVGIATGEVATVGQVCRWFASRVTYRSN